MSIIFRQIEWADHNTERSYPLTVDSSKKDSSGSFVIPDDFLVGMSLAVNVSSNIKPNYFYISKIGVFPQGFTLTVSYDDGSLKEVVATANISRNAYKKYEWYRLTGVGAFSDTVGHVQLGNLDGVDSQPAGLFEFDKDSARLEADVIKPVLRGVTSIRIKNGNNLSAPIYGHVVLSAGQNTKIESSVSSGVTTIVINAIEGEGLNDDCLCESEAPCIKTINRIPPASDGNFTITPGTCIDIQALGNGLQISDTCSEPCCGCEELETITNELVNLGNRIQTAERVAQELSAKIGLLESIFQSSTIDKCCE